MADDDAITKAKGTIEEKAGWAAGDRRVEAKGAVEKETGETPDEDRLAEAEDEVRRDHGDIAEPQH